MPLMCNLTKYIICLSILTLSACSRNDPKRDVINFKRKTTDVRDSIIAMNSLMDRLNVPKQDYRIKGWFFVNDNIIDINGNRYNFNKSKSKHFTVLETLPSKDRFLNLISYLKDNELTSCRQDCSMSYNTCGYYYSYKDVGDEPSDIRDIALENPIYYTEKSDEKHDFKILDHKKGLALLAIAER